MTKAGFSINRLPLEAGFRHRDRDREHRDLDVAVDFKRNGHKHVNPPCLIVQRRLDRSHVMVAVGAIKADQSHPFSLPNEISS